ncbi:uncharacterized protein LOC130589412 [Beta vulgaris subsp. vulgaris]|uniref:uncharacterized protein LOC130589412 n=1 Tax=Beta vulgaris subsp. vulgaris TaxID=3555 RepID=UPI002547CF39|nr:uncharacterized protein LOC130589412 [Beta vulgaris subsp. vulgaris]
MSCVPKKSTENEKENEEKNKALHFELKFEHHGVPTSLVQDMENDWYLQAGIAYKRIDSFIPFFHGFIYSLADSKGELQLMSGSIQPIDVWHSRGVRYHVQFNEFNQPIRKGGHILVRFLGSVAKDGTYCPIGEKNWHHVDVKLKTKIVMKMREHFVIPEDEVYNTLALQRVDKCWRHYKHSLKLTFFKPDKLTEEEHYDIVPSGHTRSEWKPLVQYWFSHKGQQLSQLGKAARAAQNQVHTLGSTSYANIRVDYVRNKFSLKVSKSSLFYL